MQILTTYLNAISGIKESDKGSYLVESNEANNNEKRTNLAIF